MARILFIGIDFHGYAREICLAGERLGHTVDFRRIEDRGFTSKAVKKLAPKAYRRRLDAYHRRIVEESAATAYDVVLFIQVHHVAPDTLERLRILQPRAHFVLYNWDSLTTHDYRPWLRFFDAAATFDPEDAASLGITYLPLFAIPAFFAIDHDRPKDFDLYFVGAIGTLHRFDAVARLYAFCQAHGLATKFHLVCSPVMRARLMRAGKDLPGVTGTGIDFAAIIDLLERSRGTFDFANHKQSGYTMRLIENMCAERKIVTENRRILDEPFYRDDRFLVVDGHDFSAVPDFLARPIESDLDTRAFSVDNWLRRLIESQGDHA